MWLVTPRPRDLEFLSVRCTSVRKDEISLLDLRMRWSLQEAAGKSVGGVIALIALLGRPKEAVLVRRGAFFASGDRIVNM